MQQLRHVVILMFKQSATASQIARIEENFIALKSLIPEIIDIEWGTNVSSENLEKGFTHCFLLTFTNAADRDTYLVHPEHKRFVEFLLPNVEDVFVIDYEAKSAQIHVAE